MSHGDEMDIINNIDELYINVCNNNYAYITLFLTDACNFCCDYCLEHASNKNNYISQTTLDVIKSLLVDKNGLIVEYYGGEPTLHPDLIKYMTQLSNMFPNKIKHILYTNISCNISIFHIMSKIKNVDLIMTIHPNMYNINNIDGVLSKLTFINDHFENKELTFLLSNNLLLQKYNKSIIKELKKIKMNNISLIAVEVEPNETTNYNPTKESFKKQYKTFKQILPSVKNNTTKESTQKTNKYTICISRLMVDVFGYITMCDRKKSINIYDVNDILPNCLLCLQDNCSMSTEKYINITTQTYKNNKYLKLFI